MKNPVTFSVYEARAVQKKRQIRQIILLCVCIVLLFGGVFFVYVLKMKENIDKTFPSGVIDSSLTTPGSVEETILVPETIGDETTEQESSETGDPTGGTEATTGTDPTELTTVSSDITDGASTDTSDESGTTDTSETTAAITPVAVPAGDVFIPETSDLQTISHKIRDAAFHKLQQQIQKSIDGYADARVGFYYLNLENNEAFGYNDMEPFVPAGAFALPVNLCLYQMFLQETALPTELMPYLAEDGSFPDSTIPKVDPYDLRTLSFLSLSSNDSVAVNMLIRRQGGIDALNEQIRLISSVVDFRSPVSYQNYKGEAFEGKNRSSAYDLAMYMEEFYLSYLSEPDVFQPMFNDLSHTESDWGIAASYPQNVLFCHQTGSASNFSNETDVALVFAQEHYVVAVTVECEDPDRAKHIQAELGQFVYQFITFCYAETPSSSVTFTTS